MPVSRDTPVLIVGAGPTGLVLALWLTRLGVRVRIIDKTAEPGTTSRALGVHARTLELYRQVGLADAVVAAGLPNVAINLWVAGARVARVPLDNVGQGLSPFPFLLIYPQDAHEQLLIARLAGSGVTVERQTELVQFEQDKTCVHATLRAASGAEQQCTTRYLAGCDGAHSTVREGLGIGFPGGTYTRVFYVADVSATGPVTDHELHVDLDQADFLAVFPLRGTGRVRLVGTLREELDRDPAELTFGDVRDRAMRQLHLAVTDVNWFSTYRVHHRVAQSFRRGRVFLLGDAAHIHSPVGAQGMNTGIGDAVNLSWKLANVLQGRAPAALLDSYEPERIAFARRLVATTDRVFTIASSDGRLAQRIRTTILPAVARPLLGLHAVRRFLFRTASQIEIDYRGGPLSEGQSGRVHGGDRLPWVPNAHTPNGGTRQDNFTPLESLSWQVHVYGDARGELLDGCTAMGLDLHVFPWTREAGRAGIMRDALYLVRPDGYVALASQVAGLDALTRYVASHGIVQAAHEPTRM